MQPKWLHPLLLKVEVLANNGHRTTFVDVNKVEIRFLPLGVNDLVDNFQHALRHKLDWCWLVIASESAQLTFNRVCNCQGTLVVDGPTT